MIINASPPIIFGKLGKLELLKNVLKKIIISEAVYEEVVEQGIKLDSFESFIIKEYIEKEEILVEKLNKKGEEKAEFLQKAYTSLHPGEVATIALGLQENEEAILIDERNARKIAELEGLRPVGSLRILLTAFKKNFIEENELRKIISQMNSMKFRLSGEVINEFWDIFEKIKRNKKT